MTKPITNTVAIMNSAAEAKSVVTNPTQMMKNTLMANSLVMKPVSAKRDTTLNSLPRDGDEVKDRININRNICVGLVISGCLAYFDDDERRGDASIVHVDEKLSNKLLVFRNGTTSFRNKVLKIKGKKKLNAKDKDSIKTLVSYNHRFVTHSDIANKAWTRLQMDIKDNRLTINFLITSLLHQLPETLKYYGFSQDRLTKLNGDGEGRVGHGYAFSSLKVANKLLGFLNEEIAIYENSSDVIDIKVPA